MDTEDDEEDQLVENLGRRKRKLMRFQQPYRWKPVIKGSSDGKDFEEDPNPIEN